MKWASLALIALVCACESATPQARSASPAPSSPVAGSPSPIPSVGPTPVPIAQVSFSCRLPFVQSLAGGHWQAGFINLPAGTFIADPNATSNSGYYDRAVSRWLPVGREAVAPDGFHYAFTDRPATYQQSPPTRASQPGYPANGCL